MRASISLKGRTIIDVLLLYTVFWCPPMQLPLEKKDRFEPISPAIEMGAYEAMWAEEGATFKKIAEKFKGVPNSLPSDFVEPKIIEDYKFKAFELLERAGVDDFGIRLHGTADYLEKLRDARYPIELLYFQGNWDLASSPSVAVVGSRNPSDEGKKRTRRLVNLLVKDNFTITSGLAKGIDTEAHLAALKAGGRTMAVIGTPISESYPKENKELQKFLSKFFLVISQVPFVRYSNQTPKYNKLFFPERNKLMSAITQATIIVEAGETSGTLVQARAALEQGRKLFILDSCFQNPDITWPERFAKQGAIRVKDYDDIREHLEL